MGQLVEKNIHSTDNGTTFLQSNDYRYNIRGWLTNINNSALSNDGVVNDDANDLFGMELKYNDVVSINSVNTTAQFNGNISAIQWKTNNLVDATTEKIYGFKYDPLNRLTDATYATKNGALWNANVSLFDENLTYDKSGNIRTLKRKSLHNSTNNALVDDLVYKYKGNQLDAVLDNATATYKPYGFTETTTLTTGEYTYDANGSMDVDQNKGIVGPSAPDPKGVLYNHLNLPREVRLGAKKIVYTYDAAGTKLRKIAYDAAGAEIARTDYIGGIQYESNVLKFMMTSEGRAVKNGSAWQYEYFHKDHLGNSRVVYGYQKQVDEYKATMESQTPIASKEQAQFYNIITTRATALNRTPASIDVVAPDKSAETNGNLTGKAIGPAKMLQVTAGDRVQLEVFARYSTGTGTNNTLITNLASAVTTTFQTVSGEAAFTALTNNVPVQAATITKASTVPKAYLFYILFNSSYVYQQFGFVQVSSAALAAHQQLYLDITIPTGGYLYTYVANESNVSASTSVYFDDFNIIHTRSASTLQVVQTTDYYPFGLAIAAQSYQKQSSLDNDYLYNGKELQDEHNLGWMDYGARMYDPAIARWFLIDPQSEGNRKWSPYRYGYNNPLRFIDPDGMFEVVINGDAAGKATEELQKSTSLKLARDEGSGKISATGEAKTDTDTKLLEAINSTTIKVEVNATTNIKLDNGEVLADGAYLGNTLSDDKKSVSAQQAVNPEALGKMSDYYGKPGADILHEVIESYVGGEVAIQTGVSGSASTNYKTVHNKTSEIAPQSGKSYTDVQNGVHYYFVDDGKKGPLIYNSYTPHKK